MEFKNKKIHFMGAGGIGVSALIKLALDRGAIVSGCDLKKNSIVDTLKDQQIPISIGHSPAHLEDCDILVYSSAVPANNLELQAAREAGIDCLSRSSMLRILQQESRLIGITGSHGKTTTTDLIAHLLVQHQYDPSVAVGGISFSLENRNFRIGQAGWFISELDESDGSMLDCSPEIGVITNIDHEHLDYYGDMQKLTEAFSEFIECLPDTGCLVICNDDIAARHLVDHFSGSCKVVRYGLTDDSHFYAKDICYEKNSTRFTLIAEGESYAVETTLLGRHNVLNSLAALAVAQFVGIDISSAVEYLKSYKAIRRRLEILYNAGPIIIDDYAHHPREIEASLKAVQSLGCKRVIAVFQAHRYTRLKDLWQAFQDVLLLTDELIVCEVYSANEEPIEGVSADLFAKEILQKGHKNVQYISKFENAMDYLKSILTRDDLVITLGAGDVNYLAKNLAIEYIKI